jgi:hypothetical protein
MERVYCQHQLISHFDREAGLEHPGAALAQPKVFKQAKGSPSPPCFPDEDILRLRKCPVNAARFAEVRHNSADFVQANDPAAAH